MPCRGQALPETRDLKPSAPAGRAIPAGLARSRSTRSRPAAAPARPPGGSSRRSGALQPRRTGRGRCRRRPVVGIPGARRVARHRPQRARRGDVEVDLRSPRAGQQDEAVVGHPRRGRVVRRIRGIEAGRHTRRVGVRAMFRHRIVTRSRSTASDPSTASVLRTTGVGEYSRWSSSWKIDSIERGLEDGPDDARTTITATRATRTTSSAAASWPSERRRVKHLRLPDAPFRPTSELLCAVLLIPGVPNRAERMTSTRRSSCSRERSHGGCRCCRSSPRSANRVWSSRSLCADPPGSALARQVVLAARRRGAAIRRCGDVVILAAAPSSPHADPPEGGDPRVLDRRGGGGADAGRGVDSPDGSAAPSASPGS